ncbi:MAG: hypothetical protein AAF433_06295 [Bacteroidota bacterium]
MKLFLSLLIFCFLAYCLPCAAQARLKASSDGSGSGTRSVLNPQVRSFLKEKTLWDNGQTYCAANFSYTRTLADVHEMGVCRSSSYVLPLMYGRRLNSTVALEGGLFGGINRSRSFGTSMFRSSEVQRTTGLAYGFLMGLSHNIHNGVDFKLRYRIDLDNGQHAWEPLQAGLSFNF